MPYALTLGVRLAVRTPSFVYRRRCSCSVLALLDQFARHYGGIMRSHSLAGSIITAAVATWSCGGGESSPSGPTSSTNPVTVNIVGSAGNQAFNPNPVQVPSGTPVVFRNSTNDVHRIVMDSGTLIGDLTPGASSSPMQVGAGGSYHCTNHPSMVGSINRATAPTPPPGSGDGY